MFEFFTRLLDTTDFPDRWHCGTWSSELGWLHIVSDLLVFAAYMAIPFVLVFFLRKRPGWPFNRLFMLFAVFIFACGAVHFIEAMIFWWPVYRLSGLLKLITAAASVGTVLALVPAAPRILSMRSPIEMAAEIEQRKLAEVQLRTSQDRLLLSVQATDLAIWDQNLPESKVWLNSNFQRTFGKPADEGNATQWWESRIHPDDRERVTSSIQDFMTSHSKEKRWSDEYRFLNAQDEYCYVKDVALIETERDEKPRRILRATTDITGLKKQEAERLKSERLRAIGQAMAGLVHESRNAVARSLAGLHLLSRKLEGEPDLLRYINEVQGAQKDVERLFEEVRQYAAPTKIERSMARLPDIAQVAWEQVLETSAAKMTPKLQQTDSDVDLLLSVDAFAMRGVFRNLFENSIAACEASPEITISYEEAKLDNQPAVTIHYRDNGTGLSESARKEIFDAFFTTKSRGTGLGMAIAKRTIEEHAGAIKVIETTRGAAFAITLPRTKPRMHDETVADSFG